MATLEATLDRLVAESVITPAQAAAVREGVSGPQRARPISPAAEVVGYIGGVLATVAALTVGAEFWQQLGDLTQFGIFAVIAVALWAGGRSISAVDDPAAGRLTSTLWLLSTSATAGAAWVVADGLLGLVADRTALVVGVVATAHALALWLVRPSVLQQLALFGSFMTALGATGALLPDPPAQVYGVTVWIVGVAWAVFTWRGLLRPAATGMAIGAVTAVVGAEILTFASETPGLLLSLTTIAVLFAAAAATRSAVFTGVASVALAIVLPQALYSWFPESVGAPIAVFIAGSVLLGGALATMRAARSGAASGVVSSGRG